MTGADDAARLGQIFFQSFSRLQLSVFEVEGRDQAWPQLLHTANSSQVEVWLSDFSPRSHHSRFLLELLAVGGASPPSRVEIHDSIDDEFTPSIFRVSRRVAREHQHLRLSRTVGPRKWAEPWLSTRL